MAWAEVSGLRPSWADISVYHPADRHLVAIDCVTPHLQEGSSQYIGVNHV